MKSWSRSTFETIPQIACLPAGPASAFRAARMSVLSCSSVMAMTSFLPRMDALCGPDPFAASRVPMHRMSGDRGRRVTAEFDHLRPLLRQRRGVALLQELDQLFAHFAPQVP